MNVRRRANRLAGDQWGDASPGFAAVVWSLLLAFGFWCVVALIVSWVAH